MHLPEGTDRSGGKERLIAANEKRSNKPQLPKKTEAQKVLRRLCGTPPSERVEQSVTDLLNGLANCPERIQHQRSPVPATHSKTQETLDNALEQQPIDEDIKNCTAISRSRHK